MNTLDELERLLKAGTPGPWWTPPAEQNDTQGLVFMGRDGGFDLRFSPLPKANAALICAAINALPELVARVRELEARVQELENAGSEMVDWAEHARIFVGSREKMHPDGQSFYDQARGNLYAVITRAALQTKGTPT